MSITFTPFLFFQSPLLSFVNDPIGSIYGGNVVDFRGAYFLDLDTAACKFGNIIVPATFITAQHMQCTAPPVAHAMSVPCRISLNGQDFTQEATTYHYFDILAIVPNVVPVRGGSRILVRTKFEGNFTLASQFCQLPWPIKTTGPDFVSMNECRDQSGLWQTLSFKVGFGDSKVQFPGFPSPLKNQIVFDLPNPIIDSDLDTIVDPSVYKIRLSIGMQYNTFFNFPHTLTFYNLSVPCGPPASPRTCNAWPLPMIKLGLGSNENITVNLTTTRLMYGTNVTCKISRYGPAHVPIYKKITLLTREDERLDTFGMREDGSGMLKSDKIFEKFPKIRKLFWGQSNLEQCARNLKVEWDIQTGCKLGLLDSLDVQWQMTSATSPQCGSNSERCAFNREEVSETESGWWKSLYLCRGPNPYSAMGENAHLIIPNDCGFGGICGSDSEKVASAQITQPMCPDESLAPGNRGETSEFFQNGVSSLAMDDMQCKCNPNRQPLSGLDCHESAPPFDTECMCSGTGSSCECKEQFHTVGEYVLENPFANSEIDCPGDNSNSTSCNVLALLKMEVKIHSTQPSFEYFRVKHVQVSCESDFILAPGVVSDDGTMITCPIPRVVTGDGVEGVVLEVSLNGLDWEEPIDFPHIDTPRVTSISPIFGIHTGGINVTVNGDNFVDDPPIYCFWVHPHSLVETPVVAQFVTSNKLICVAPPLTEENLLTMQPFTPLMFGVYVSLNGRERGESAITGKVQDSAFNYFRLPDFEAVDPDVRLYVCRDVGRVCIINFE